MPLSCRHYRAMLANRSTWPVVGHLRPMACRVCMEIIAEYMASEIHHDLDLALDRPPSAYQAAMAGDLEHGYELRRMTAQLCFLHQPEFGDLRRGATAEDLWIADEVIPPAISETRSEVAA